MPQFLVKWNNTWSWKSCCVFFIIWFTFIFLYILATGAWGCVRTGSSFKPIQHQERIFIDQFTLLAWPLKIWFWFKVAVGQPNGYLKTTDILSSLLSEQTKEICKLFNPPAKKRWRSYDSLQSDHFSEHDKWKHFFPCVHGKKNGIKFESYFKCIWRTCYLRKPCREHIKIQEFCTYIT